MRLTQLLHRVCCAVAAACGLTLCGITSAWAQGLTVAAITVDGKAAQSVAGVVVRIAGAVSGERQILNTRQAIAPGTELMPPRGARITLQSSNGNIIILFPGARFLAGVVTGRGEAHQPLGGRIDFQVRKALDYFNIQYDRITASVKGTHYSVVIDPARSLMLSVTQGVVEVERQVYIRFAALAADSTAEAQSRGIRLAEELKAGQSKTYALNVSEYLAEFKNFGEAETYFRNAFGAAQGGNDRRLTLRAVFNLIETYWRVGKPRSMLELEGKCIEVAQALSARDSEAACLRLAGVAYYELAEYRRAIAYFEKSLAMNERLYPGRDRPAIAMTLNNLGIAYSGLGEYRTAIEYHEKSLAMRSRLYAGRDHPEIAGSLSLLGIACDARGEYRKAIAYHQKALAMRERVFGGQDHPATAQSLRNLANAHDKAGNAADAARYRERADTMQRRLQPK
jgi:tetratricopeptide (TPR) repeat protein